MSDTLPLPKKGRKEFLDQPVKLNREDVPVPEWGLTIPMRELTAEEKQEYEASIVSFDKQGRPKVNSKDAAVKLIVKAAIDESGEPFFDGGDIPRLRKQQSSVTDKLFKVAKALSRIDDEDLEKLKNV